MSNVHAYIPTWPTSSDEFTLFYVPPPSNHAKTKHKRKQAREFLQSYSGRSVRTVTALCVTNLDTGADAEGVHESTVHWMEISPTIVDRVMANGTTMGSVRKGPVFFFFSLALVSFSIYFRLAVADDFDFALFSIDAAVCSVW